MQSKSVQTILTLTVKFTPISCLSLLAGIGLIGSSIALFSGEGLSLIMPEAYHAAALPLSILCFGIIFQSTQQITGTGISLEKKTSLFMWMAWATAIFNVAGNLILIPLWGATERL
ncbi:MAG: polysaccharide biosynthesis C-terminal domain-containing protein [Alphaproteobacteria bacterium]